MEHPQIQFQLERWTGREYVPHGAPHLTTNPHTAGDYAERARMLGLPSWRMVRTDKARPAKVPKRRKNWGYNREPCSLDKEQQIKAYLLWAKSRGLDSVAYYIGRPMHPELSGLAVRLVDPADFLGPVYPDLELAEAA